MNPVLDAMAEAVAAADGGRVDLSGRQLRALPDVFTPDMAIRALDLSGNRFTELPPSLLRIVSLEELDLGGNRLRALPPGLGDLTRLRLLDVSENRLEALPPELSRCVALADVRLYGNRLTDLSPLAALPDLARLDVSGNRLRTLATVPPNLVALDVCGNDLTELPDDFGGLARLRLLDLSGNRLTDVTVLRSLRLEELHLDDNALAEWPAEVAAAPTLRRFSAFGNPAPVPDEDPSAELTEAVRAHTTGAPDPSKQYFDAATWQFAFSLAVTGGPAIWALVDHYYKRFRGVDAAITLADGTRLELGRIPRKSAERLVSRVGEGALERALMDFQPTKDLGQRRQVERCVAGVASRVGLADLIAEDGAHTIVHIDARRIVMGDEITIKDITNGIVNVKSRLTDVKQTIGTAATLDGATKAELDGLLARLEAELADLPADRAEEAEAVAKTTADLVGEATKDKPNKKLVATASSGLRALVAGLGAVTPIAVAIIDLVGKIVA